MAAYSAGAPRQLLTFKHDYLGRRVRKTVATWNGSAYVASLDRKFIYDDGRGKGGRGPKSDF